MSLIRAAAYDAVLAYVWGRVCFNAWDDTLARLAALTRFESWPPWLCSLLHVLWPAYFVYTSTKRLTGRDAPPQPTRRRAILMLALACIVLGVRGARAGFRERRRLLV